MTQLNTNKLDTDDVIAKVNQILQISTARTNDFLKRVAELGIIDRRSLTKEQVRR
jgi:predicted transcriptional regulator